MKKNIKMLFAFVVLFICIGIVSAYSTYYTSAESTRLYNKIDENWNVTRPAHTAKVTRSGNMKTIVDKIHGVSDINNGANADGGIRLFTTIKYKEGFLSTKTDERYNAVFKTTTNTPACEYSIPGSKDVTIEWQNRTGNTELYARFRAQ